MSCHHLSRLKKENTQESYGPFCDKGIWCIRTIEELNNLYQNTDTVKHVKLRRLEWLGHLIRMENNRIPNIALDAKLDGKMEVVRPKLRQPYRFVRHSAHLDSIRLVRREAFLLDWHLFASKTCHGQFQSTAPHSVNMLAAFNCVTTLVVKDVTNTNKLCKIAKH